ncbi:MAG: hypothetical protein VX399_04965 [SAR324 cluster bacterium]|nr:hypothetical protein [SAR324 cluster bacterium]
MNLEKPAVGILGMGYFGRVLASMEEWHEDSWGSWHSVPMPASGLRQFRFSWENPDDWKQIPSGEVVLVLAIPPPPLETDSLEGFLSDWSLWMKCERPLIRRLVYISTTGVYPKKAGVWSEDSVFESETESGLRRMLTERVLSRHFELQVVRPGGIYGPSRNLLERLKAGRRIPDTGAPTHRIHVRDLVRIVSHCIRNPELILINAVDHHPCPSREVVLWLLDHHPDAKGLNWSEPESPRKELPVPRYISNRCLRDLGIGLEYPSFKEGML